MPEITIIMPLYNADVYVRESLESIQRQTFKNFELLCINDASTDSTSNILKEYQKRDSRIRILDNSKREGAAYSRNRGIHESQGRYLSFLDGDDIFDEEMLEMAYLCAEKKEADVVIFDYQHVRSEDIYHKIQKIHGIQYMERFCGDTFRLLDYQPYQSLVLGVSPCNKLYRKEFVVLNKLYFQSLPSSNDVYFVSMALFTAKKISVLNARRVLLYAREHRAKNRISYMRDPMCVYAALDKLQDELLKNGCFEELSEIFFCRAYWALITGLKKSSTVEISWQFYCFLKEEGIKRFVDRAKECYDKLGHGIRNQFERFYNEDFSMEWIRNEDVFDYFLEQETVIIRKVFENEKKKKHNVAVWGAGKNGQALLTFCQKNNLEVFAVIDTDSQKRGETLCGYRIEEPDRVINSISTIILSPQNIYNDISSFLEAKNYKISLLDIHQIVGLI